MEEAPAMLGLRQMEAAYYLRLLMKADRRISRRDWVRARNDWSRSGRRKSNQFDQLRLEAGRVLVEVQVVVCQH